LTRWAARLRIRTRLILAFAVLLGLLIALAVLSVRWQNQFSAALTQLISEQFELREVVAEVDGNAEDATRRLLVLMSTNRGIRVSAYTEIDAANRRLDTAMRVLDARLAGSAERVALDAVWDRVARYRRSYADVVDRIEANDFDSARELLGSDTEVELTLLTQSIRNLSATSERAAAEQAGALRERVASARNIVIALCLLGLALGGLLAFGVTRSIARPLGLAEAGARRIAAGDYEGRIEVPADDELGRMADAMNTMAEAVAARERRLRQLADSDLLTGLAQRSRFVREGDAMLAALPGDRPLALLMCLDVDRLKAVNSVLGFDAGDALLIGAASKLAGLFNGAACCGRLAGGTFVCMLPLDRAERAESVANELCDEVEQQVVWQGQALDLSVSVGVALFPEHEGGTEALLRRAEQAMFEAKRSLHRITLYHPTLEASRAQHLSLLSALQTAIERNQLRQFLQPKLDLRSGKVVGVEALVRWQHPERGWLPPSEFIPFAESTGRIQQVTHWMLERAVSTLREWQNEGRRDSIAVNISTLDVQDARLPEHLAELLARHKVDPELLQLEVTETGLMTSDADPISVMHGLRRLGVRLAIDDFGTGQSSLAYLQRLPVDELKIDRSFVQNVERDARRQALLRSIVGLGRSLGLTVTAEGVENEAELQIVRDCGCALVQGYLIAKPQSLEAYESWRQQRLAATG